MEESEEQFEPTPAASVCSAGLGVEGGAPVYQLNKAGLRRSEPHLETGGQRGRCSLAEKGSGQGKLESGPADASRGLNLAGCQEQGSVTAPALQAWVCGWTPWDRQLSGAAVPVSQDSITNKIKQLTVLILCSQRPFTSWSLHGPHSVPLWGGGWGPQCCCPGPTSPLQFPLLGQPGASGSLLSEQLPHLSLDILQQVSGLLLFLETQTG